MPVALIPSCDNQSCLQTLASVHWDATAPAENHCTIQSCLRLEEREQLEQLSRWFMDSQPFRPGCWITRLSCSVSGSSVSRTWSLAGLPSPPAPPLYLNCSLSFSLSLCLSSVSLKHILMLCFYLLFLGYLFSTFKCLLVLEKKISVSILLLLFVVCHPQSIFPMILSSCYRQFSRKSMNINEHLLVARIIKSIFLPEEKVGQNCF